MPFFARIILGMFWVSIIGIGVLLCVTITKLIIRKFRNKKYIQGGLIITVVAAVIITMTTLYHKNQTEIMPMKISKENRQYITDINQIKESESGTKVKLNRVFMDLDSFSFNLGVKGKDKLVAVELKKNPEDNEALGQVMGLWTGDRFLYSYGGYQIGYKSDTFINPLYLVAYLSNGEDVTFAIKDEKNIADKVAVKKLDAVVDIDNSKVKFDKIYMGLNYAAISFSTDSNLWGYEISILIDGHEQTDVSWSIAGGSGNSEGTIGTPSIGTGEAILRIKNKTTGKSYDVKIQ